MNTEPNYEQLFQSARSAAETFAIIEQIRDSKNLEKYAMALLLGLNPKQCDYEKRKAGAGTQYSLLKNRKNITPRIIREAIRVASIDNEGIRTELSKIKAGAA